MSETTHRKPFREACFDAPSQNSALRETITCRGHPKQTRALRRDVSSRIGTQWFKEPLRQAFDDPSPIRWRFNPTACSPKASLQAGYLGLARERVGRLLRAARETTVRTPHRCCSESSSGEPEVNQKKAAWQTQKQHCQHNQPTPSWGHPAWENTFPSLPPHWDRCRQISIH